MPRRVAIPSCIKPKKTISDDTYFLFTSISYLSFITGVTYYSHANYDLYSADNIRNSYSY